MSNSEIDYMPVKAALHGFLVNARMQRKLNVC